MKPHIFILGRTPELAFLELATFLPDVIRVTPDVARSANAVPIGILGGTVKIAEVVGHVPSIEAEVLAQYIRSPGSFGVSMYGAGKISRHVLEDIKKLVHGSRFVEARDGNVLSSVVVEKEHLQELILVKDSDGYIVAKTVAVQPFEEWSQRDYGRPFADPKAGMLPPKVSRMIVNIAGAGSGKTLLDPFCGMGTVLSEALLMGWNVVGSDQAADVIEKTRANLRWITGTNKLGVTYRLVVSDAVHISKQLDSSTVDAIVTEPFMGATHISHTSSRIPNIIKGLEKLYIGCLKDWKQLLKPHGVVMIALPTYELNGKMHFVKKVIDMCEILGYTIQAGPIEYGRPGAIVKRNFYLFQKK